MKNNTPDHLLRLPEVLDIIPISKSSLWQGARQGVSQNQLEWESAAHFGDLATLRNYSAQHEENLSNVRFRSTR